MDRVTVYSSVDFRRTAAKITGMTPKKIDRRLAAAAIGVMAAYVILAYVLAPFFWRHFEHQPRLADMQATTRTALGLPGDAINVGLEGTEDDVLCAMNAAGWRPADPVTLSSSLRIAGSVVFDRPYQQAPVSPLFYDNRKQDLAFEKPAGKSATKRHHVRFWKALDAGDDGLPVWLGAATFDDKVGVSHYTGQITHHMAPDIDAERDLLSATSPRPTRSRRPIRSAASDRRCSRATAAAIPISPMATYGVQAGLGLRGPGARAGHSRRPASIKAKNAVFSWLAALWRALPKRPSLKTRPSCPD